MKRAAALLAAVMLIAGCLSLGPRERQRTRYYVLSIPGEPTATLPGPVRFGPFTVDPPYASARFAYRTSPYRLDYYTYHRWVSDPRHLVAGAMRDYLERAEHDPAGAPLDVSGHVRVLEEDEREKDPAGRIALDLRVTRAGKVLERLYTESERAGSGRPEAIAEALSKSLGRIVDRMLSDVSQP